MPRLTAAEEFLSEEEPLELPYGGKVYRVPALDALRWVQLHALDAVGLALRLNARPSEEDAAVVDAMSQTDMYRCTLGATFDELVADDVDPRVIEAASRTAGAFHRWGLERAEQVWRDLLGGAKGATPAATPPPPSTT